MATDKLHTLKIRGISYLTFAWDDKVPLMIRQGFIDCILKVTSLKSLVKVLSEAGLTKGDLQLMLTKMYTKENARLLTEGLDR